MKFLAKSLWIAWFTWLAGVAGAFSQAQIVVDEFANGTLNGTPLQNIGVHPLEYVLPFPGTPGAVVMTEPNSAEVSDVINFDGNFHLWFYSDLDGPDSLADTLLAPILNNLPANTFYVEEIGLWGQPYNEELNAGAYWVPTAGQPGYDPLLLPQYTFISEIPEPGSLSLLLCSLGFVGMKFLWRTLRK